MLRRLCQATLAMLIVPTTQRHPADNLHVASFFLSPPAPQHTHQVASTKSELASQQKALADAAAAKASAEQQLDRLTQHLDETEAQLQETK